MPDVLPMTAAEIRHPIALGVLMIPDDRALDAGVHEVTRHTRSA